jgi:hypothetical protein
MGKCSAQAKRQPHGTLCRRTTPQKNALETPTVASRRAGNAANHCPPAFRSFLIALISARKKLDRILMGDTVYETVA